MTRERPFAPRRILIALDGSAHSLVALAAAAELASRLHAELSGLFVEDIDLLRLGRLPFAAHVSLSGRLLPTQDLEAQLRALAAEAHHALEAAADRLRLRRSFQVVRGRVRAEVVAASAGTDLLIVGWASRPLRWRERLGGTARAVAERSEASVLLLPGEATLELPVVVVFDDSEPSEAALIAAARLAEAVGRGLTILVSGTDAAAALDLERRASVLAGAGMPVRFQSLPGAQGNRLRQALVAAVPALFVIAAAHPLLQGAGAVELLERLRSPLLLVR